MNHQYKLASRPVGLPKKETWTYETNPIPSPQEGEVLVKILYISLDPAMRGWMNEGDSYLPAIKIGEVMRAGTVGKVIESKNSQFSVGDYVTGALGVQNYAISNGQNINRIDISLAPLSNYLGVLGVAGLTAYFAFLNIGQPQAGDHVLVSAAAGAVGQVVGQIAKIKGCRVVGMAGSPAKCEYLEKELGFDATINYKTEEISKALREKCSQGVDIYFDNVGGEILDKTLLAMNERGRIICCGAISQYNNTELYGLKNYFAVITKRLRMEGMIVIDYMKEFPSAIMEMAQWMKEGKLQTREQIEEGIEHFPEVFLKLFSGDKMGKLILKVAEDD